MITLTTTPTIAGNTMQGLIQDIAQCESAARMAYDKICKGRDVDTWGQYAQTAEERAEAGRERVAALVEAMFPGVSAEEIGRVLL